MREHEHDMGSEAHRHQCTCPGEEENLRYVSNCALFPRSPTGQHIRFSCVFFGWTGAMTACFLCMSASSFQIFRPLRLFDLMSRILRTGKYR
jgi:hypothetical protein